METLFFPPRRKGLIFHLGAGLLLLAAGGLLMVYAFSQARGGMFVLLLFLALALLTPVPLVIYRGYALLRASYSLERDGLRLRWGLRGQDIPLPQIEWIRPAAELGFQLPLPFLPTPGALLGTRHVPELGPVEFMASETDGLLLLATPERIYAISPSDPRAFLRSSQRIFEYGSLTPLAEYSSRPAAYLSTVWAERWGRWPLAAGALLTFILLAVVSLRITTGNGSVSVGFDPTGLPLPPVPTRQLMLLPILAGFGFLLDALAGLYFFRYEHNRSVAYLLWLTSPLAPLLLLISALFFLR